MTRSVSETSLVSVPSIQMNNSQIVLHDEDDDTDTVLDVEEYCSNREVVNLENAAVNIDNSNDVIIGPVTQFNVNGNVTIYSNGNTTPLEATNEVTIGEHQQHNNNFTDQARLGKLEKSESEELDKEKLKNKKIIKIFLLISFVLLLTIVIIVLVLHYTKNTLKDSSDYVPPEQGNGSSNLGEHQVLDRTVWGGRSPTYTVNITSPVPMVIIKHTGGGQCHYFTECAGKLQTIQSMSFSNGQPDIYYSFLIGSDNNIYVGRGWDVQPSQRNDTIDIAFLGSYSADVFTPNMIDAAQKLLQFGVDNNKLTKDYILVAHNQTRPTESPGSNVFKEIQTWPHYDGRIYMSNNTLG